MPRHGSTSRVGSIVAGTSAVVCARRRDVGDRLTPRVVGRVVDRVVDALGRLAARSTSPRAVKSPPSLSVADVKTTVLSASSLCAQLAPHLDRSDAQLVAAALTVALGEPEHVGLAVLQPSARRSCGSRRPCPAPAAGLRRPRPPATPSGTPRTPCARRAATSVERVGQRSSGSVSIRPGSSSSSASAQRVGGVGQVVGLAAVDEVAGPPGRSLDRGQRQLVGRSLGHPGASSCASSTTTTS